MFVSSVFLLTGCFGQSPEEKIYEVLELVATAEKTFEEQQDPLVQLEKDEKVLYDKIISIGKKDQEQINQLSDTALDNIEKRKNLMQKEQESMDSSEKEFKKAEKLIDDIKNDQAKKEVEKLQDIMQDRYKTHDSLYENYNRGLEYDQQLYLLLKNKATNINQLEDQIVKINKTYGKVIKNKEDFNRLTKKYNETKLLFYKQAELNIKTN